MHHPNVTSRLLPTLVIILLGLTVNAQEFRFAGGLRIGLPSSVSVKAFISPRDALEFQLGWRSYADVADAINLTSIYQIHRPLFGRDELEYYYGAGLGLQYWDYVYDTKRHLTVAAVGCLGTQYTFPRLPLSLTLDWTPTVLILTRDTYRGMENPWYTFGALGLRFVFSR